MQKKFNDHLSDDAPLWYYVEELSKVIDKKCFGYICAIHNNVVDVDFKHLYKQTVRFMVGTNDKTWFVHWLNVEDTVVGSIRVYLNNNPLPHLKEEIKEGNQNFQDIIENEIEGIDSILASSISYFLLNTKMSYLKFAQEWNRQVDDGDDYMIFRATDNFYTGMTHKLCIKKSDVFSNNHRNID